MSARPRQSKQAVPVADDDHHTVTRKEFESLRALKVKMGQNTMAVIWNLLGDSAQFVGKHDWSGKVSPANPYPQEIISCQYGSFLHLRDLKTQKSEGVVVYSGLNNAGQQYNFLVAWSNSPGVLPLSGKLAYTEILDAGPIPDWDNIYQRLISGTDHDTKTRDGLVSSVKWLSCGRAGPMLEISFELDIGLYN